MASKLDRPGVIVAIDFGTTYSGFSFVHAPYGETDLDKLLDDVSTYEHWPYQDKAGERQYPKTQTSLLYMRKKGRGSAKPIYELKAWGWKAYYDYQNILQESKQVDNSDGTKYYFLTKFKLALAASQDYGESYQLPGGLTAERVISDYLHQLSLVIDKELQNTHGRRIPNKEIQYCLTVPAIWSQRAKDQMKTCAEKAGLISGPSNTSGAGSPHPLAIVLEPDAASAYCMHSLRKTRETHLAAGSRILVVDAGGGTVDLVFHEKVSSSADCHQVKEIYSGGSGDLCGATYVDAAFEKLLSRKIPCYENFMSEKPAAVFKVRKIWEGIKLNFDPKQSTPYEFWLPYQLGDYWRTYDKEKGLHRPDEDYHQLMISVEDMTAVFDKAVNRILELIEQQLAQVSGKPVDALLVVGGFSACSYMIDRIRTKFSRKVKKILNPPHSGQAVLTGAIAFGVADKELVTARISRKTYGIGVFNGRNDFGQLLDLKFCVFVRKGEEVTVEQKVEKPYFTAEWDSPDPEVRESTRRDPSFSLDVYSSWNRNPESVTDPGTTKESTYRFEIPPMKEKPEVKVTIFFGKSAIKLTAVGVNFSTEIRTLPSVTFDADSVRLAA
ncbi:unnamed protein product [Calypogeia fissa]